MSRLVQCSARPSGVSCASCHRRSGILLPPVPMSRSRIFRRLRTLSSVSCSDVLGTGLFPLRVLSSRHFQLLLLLLSTDNCSAAPDRSSRGGIRHGWWRYPTGSALARRRAIAAAIIRHGAQRCGPPFGTLRGIRMFGEAGIVTSSRPPPRIFGNTARLHSASASCFVDPQSEVHSQALPIMS